MSSWSMSPARGWLASAISIGTSLTVACGDDRRAADPGATATPTTADDDRAVVAAAAAPATPHAATAELAPCDDPALHFEDGAERGWLCPDAARDLGLTIVDLSERWAPRPFADGPNGKGPRFKDTYLALAAENDPDGGELPPEERLVEMYGVTPAPSVVLRRLQEDQRHACHAAIDDEPLRQPIRTLKEAANPIVNAADNKRRWLGVHLDKQRKQRKLPDIAALGKLKPYKHEVAVWQRLEAEAAAVRTAQQHLVCEGLLKNKFVDGKLTWLTADKIDLYQRSNFLLPHGELDADTREAMAAGGLELAYRAALRLLRERVVDATGLIEDGSAGTGATPVLGRYLEPAVMRHVKGHKPLPNAAPDLIHPATETAAVAVGWTTPERARDFLARHKGEPLKVAIALPAPPAYHSAHMDLRAVLDRGDVWYSLKPQYRTPAVRPSLTIYAKDGDRELALVRWPSTIGGWADEVMPGNWVKKQWKESDVGKRVWKELYVAPTWQPPDTTPDEELMRNLWNGKWRLKREVLGPGPRSAYGMVMLINHKPVKKGKKTYWGDNGIRIHGTSGVTSVVRGTSHGCHRLFNHLAVRLGSFLLHHREHVVRGDQRSGYGRIVKHKGELYPVKLTTRGYLYELTPPVSIEVTKGRIRSPRKVPPPK
jgi:hypothetical protein